MGRNVITKKALTLEEFMDLVKKDYMKVRPTESDEEALEYFNGDEAQEYIKSEYESAVNDFNDGELGADGFKIGKVSAVANCLYMMCD